LGGKPIVEMAICVCFVYKVPEATDSL